MIKLTNVAYKRLFKELKFEGEKLSDLSDLQLKELAHAVGTVNIVREVKKRSIKIFQTRRILSEKEVEKMLTFSDYVTVLYWTDEQVQFMDEQDYFKDMEKAGNGRDMYVKLSENKLAFFDLKPGSEALLDVGMDWVNDYLVSQPYARYLEIENLDTGIRTEVKRKTTLKKTINKLGQAEELITVTQILIDQEDSKEGLLTKNKK